MHRLTDNVLTQRICYI